MQPLLRVSDIRKRFLATQALDGVNLQVQPGEVHALIGENGAGKSTLMNILFGALAPDSGGIELGGEAYAPRTPIEARAAGVAMVHQEPMLCPHLSVRENILLGIEPSRFGFVDAGTSEARVKQALAAVAPDQTELPLDPSRVVDTLSPSDRQLVTIARALAQSECRLLILDEPTSSLTADDVQRLFRVLDKLKMNSVSIVYISHFLEEVRRIADSFTVLRDGKSVSSGTVADVSDDDLVRMMVGREVKELFVRSKRTPGEVVLELEGLAGYEKPASARLKSSNLELRSGEVIGVFGLVGSGRTELLRTIFGLDAVASGRIRVTTHLGAASPTRRWAEGVGFSSKDRKGEGLSETQSVADNLTLTRLEDTSRPKKSFGFVSPTRLEHIAQRFVDELRIRCAGPGQTIRELSGGNQQKVALARLLHHEADILLLDEPTRGIDVQSRSEVYGIIDRLATEGKAVLMVSSYLPELLGVCDRIAVMRRGRLGSVQAADALDQDSLLREAIG